MAQRSRGGRILGTETTADGSPVRLVGRALHQQHRIVGTEGSFGALGDAVHSLVRCWDRPRSA